MINVMKLGDKTIGECENCGMQHKVRKGVVEE